MSVPISLVLETANGSATEEYRVIDGEIQVRELSPNPLEDSPKWRIVSPEELIVHV